MGTITARDLSTGDVLLYNSDGFISDAICFFDGTPYSHASLYLGNDCVGEALPEGLRNRGIKQSIEHSNYVLGRRLISSPPSMAPVITVADRYLTQGNRYGFEQLLLLAILTLTRRLKENKYLSWLVRKVLDNAADYLMDHSDRQPMICSEFVYTCYDEAIPGPTDAFTLRINAYPVVSSVVPGVRILGAPIVQHPDAGLHRDSLLAWAIQSRGTAPAKSAPVAAGISRAKKGTKEAVELSRTSLDEIIKAYLIEAGKPKAVAADPRTPEVMASIEQFARASQEAAVKRQGADKKPSKPGPSKLPIFGAKAQDPLQYLLDTVANFVTPGDLMKCSNLHDVGTIKI